MVKQKPTETAWVTWSRSGSGSGLVVLVTMVGGIHPSRVRVEYDADPVVVGPLLRSPEGSEGHQSRAKIEYVGRHPGYVSVSCSPPGESAGGASILTVCAVPGALSLGYSFAALSAAH
jgi:hypothetical protein